MLFSTKLYPIYQTGSPVGVLPDVYGLQIKDRIYKVKNSIYPMLSKFEVVFESGSQGYTATVAPCASNYYAKRIKGILLENISKKHKGDIQLSGIIKGYDTSGYELNQELWLSAERGKFTNIEPVGSYKVSIGTVIKVDPVDGWFILNIMKIGR